MKVIDWYFNTPRESDAASSIIAWWEARRIPYNIVLALFGPISMALTFVLIADSGTLQPGEDAIEPIAWVGLPLLGVIFFNCCYTSGWLVELMLRLIHPDRSERVGGRLLTIGTFFSVFLVSAPALLWGAYDVFNGAI